MANTPERRKQSLLTQLLAVAMPSVSPVKPAEPPKSHDDSWEQPGQEGEISLVASSIQATDDEEYDVDQSLRHDHSLEEREEDSWNGTPVVISSPLNLPEGDGSREISLHELNPEISADWAMMVPDDMSNLLSERWSPTDPSFSISDPPPASTSRMPRPTRNLSVSPRAQYSSTSPAQHPARESSQSPGPTPRPVLSSRSPQLSPNVSSESSATDIMATVRKRASPIKFENIDDSFVPLEPSTPTPATKPIGSIFAEMSAEQADMSWPLRGDDDISPLHSTVFAADASALDLPPLSARSDKHTSPSPAGDRTEFFDCSTSGFEFSPLSKSLVAQTPTPSARLMQPTKQLFEAQNAHSRALVEEVNLYRDLASRLHAEVVERDSLLADLTGRVLDAEEFQREIGDLREEVERLKIENSKSTPPGGRDHSASTEGSPSPLATKSAHVGDRTTVIEAETRDLEIRLSKALAEHDVLRKQVAETKLNDEAKDRELDHVRQEMADLEDRYRDQLISLRQSPPPPPQLSSTDTQVQAELDDALARCSTLEIEVTRACDKAEDLTMQVQDMREVKAVDEEEIDRLTGLLDSARDSRRNEEDMRSRLEAVERRLEAEVRRKEELEQYVRDERDARKRTEQENREVSLDLASKVEHTMLMIQLMKSLHTTRQQLAQRSSPKQDPATTAEIARLRSESASKDLEIVNLQRRKNELKEDREMLNIALDSKQQELELVSGPSFKR